MYSKEIYAAVREQFEDKRKLAEKQAEQRRDRAYEEAPALKQIDDELAQTGVRLVEMMLTSRADVSAVKEENRLLQQKRAELLASMGHPADWTEPAYQCSLCRDTGRDGKGGLCPCFVAALGQESFQRSPVAVLAKSQNFDTYSLDPFTGKAREEAANRLEYCRKYAKNFASHPHSLLLQGATGLGKTHLATAIAAELLRQGFRVEYDTAFNLFSAFERNRFGRGENETDKYFDCDLLIVDDLGAEPSGNFNEAAFYNLLNTRNMYGRPLLITTNLSVKELGERYGARCISRLFGDMECLRFTGRDMRIQRRKPGAE